jgi:hypothetical protein
MIRVTEFRNFQNITSRTDKGQSFNETTGRMKSEWVSKKKKKTPWLESTSELYRPSDRRLSEKLVPTFVARGCRVVSVTDP